MLSSTTIWVSVFVIIYTGTFGTYAFSYTASDYFVFGTRLSFDDAKVACQNAGGSLASVPTSQNAEWLREHLPLQISSWIDKKQDINNCGSVDPKSYYIYNFPNYIPCVWKNDFICRKTNGVEFNPSLACSSKLSILTGGLHYCTSPLPPEAGCLQKDNFMKMTNTRTYRQYLSCSSGFNVLQLKYEDNIKAKKILQLLDISYGSYWVRLTDHTSNTGSYCSSISPTDNPVIQVSKPCGWDLEYICEKSLSNEDQAICRYFGTFLQDRDAYVEYQVADAQAQTNENANKLCMAAGGVLAPVFQKSDADWLMANFGQSSYTWVDDASTMQSSSHCLRLTSYYPYPDTAPCTWTSSYICRKGLGDYDMCAGVNCGIDKDCIIESNYLVSCKCKAFMDPAGHSCTLNSRRVFEEAYASAEGGITAITAFTTKYEKYGELLIQRCNGGLTTYCQLSQVVSAVTILHGTAEQRDSRTIYRINSKEYKNIDMEDYLGDLKQSIDEKKEALDRKKDLNVILASISSLSYGLSTYFKKQAEYQVERIGHDIAFLQQRLRELSNAMTSTIASVQEDLRYVTRHAVDLAAADAAEKAVQLAFEILSCANPLSFLSGGCTANDIADRTAALAKAISTAFKAEIVKKAFEETSRLLASIAVKFKNNAKQLEVRNKVFKEIQDGLTDVESLTAQFLELYGSYAPEVTNQDIAAIIASLSNIQTEACDIAQNAEGISTNIGKSVDSGVNGETSLEGRCTKLPVTISKLDSIFQDSFAFQFDLIDAFADAVQSNLAERNAKSMHTSSTLTIGQTVVGLLNTNVQLQKTLLVFCNMILYNQADEEYRNCQKSYFLDSDIDLIQRYQTTTILPTTRTAKLPTWPSSPDDHAFINLELLLKGETVYFQIPKGNTTWLVNNNWVYGSQINYAHYVNSMGIYLPNLATDSRCFYNLHVKVVSSELTSVLRGENANLYMLYPETYTLIYENDKGQEYCAQNDKIYNPTSPSERLCIRKKPEVKTRQNSAVKSPSLYSFFEVSIPERTGTCGQPHLQTILSNREVKVLLTMEVKSPDDAK